MESIYTINQRVWNTGVTEYHKFRLNGSNYTLVQVEDPKGRAGHTYVFNSYRDQPILYINWQACGVNGYVAPHKLERTEDILVWNYLLNTDAAESKRCLESCYLQISEASEGFDDDWLQFRYFPENSLVDLNRLMK